MNPAKYGHCFRLPAQGMILLGLLLSKISMACNTTPIASPIDIVSTTIAGTVDSSSEHGVVKGVNTFELSISRYWPILCRDGCDKQAGFGAVIESIDGEPLLAAVGKFAFSTLLGAEAGPIYNGSDYGGTVRLWFGLGHFGLQSEWNYLREAREHFIAIGIYAALPIHIVVDKKHEFFPKWIPSDTSD